MNEQNKKVWVKMWCTCKEEKLSSDQVPNFPWVDQPGFCLNCRNHVTMEIMKNPDRKEDGSPCNAGCPTCGTKYTDEDVKRDEDGESGCVISDQQAGVPTVEVSFSAALIANCELEEENFKLKNNVHLLHEQAHSLVRLVTWFKKLIVVGNMPEEEGRSDELTSAYCDELIEALGDNDNG